MSGALGGFGGGNAEDSFDDEFPPNENNELPNPFMSPNAVAADFEGSLPEAASAFAFDFEASTALSLVSLVLDENGLGATVESGGYDDPELDLEDGAPSPFVF